MTNKKTQKTMTIKILILFLLTFFLVGCFLPSVTSNTDYVLKNYSDGPSTWQEVSSIGQDKEDIYADFLKAELDGDYDDAIIYRMLYVRKTTDETMLKLGFSFSFVGGGLSMILGAIALALLALSFKFKTFKFAKFFIIACLIMCALASIGTVLTITANSSYKYAFGLGRIFMLIGSSLAVIFAYLIKSKKA